MPMTGRMSSGVVARWAVRRARRGGGSLAIPPGIRATRSHSAGLPVTIRAWGAWRPEQKVWKSLARLGPLAAGEFGNARDRGIASSGFRNRGVHTRMNLSAR
jgi:hypothetical protein